MDKHLRARARTEPQLCALCPHNTPKRPHSRHSRTFACLPHCAAARCLCWVCRRGRGAGAPLLATSPPCALRGDTVTRLQRGQQRWPGDTSWPWDTPCTPGMLRGGTRGVTAAATLPQPGGTFGADQLRVLLPGPAEILQGWWRLGLEALELLQPILQAPGSLQHRSRVCGMWDGR